VWFTMKIFTSYRFGEQSVFRDLDDIPPGVDFRTVLEFRWETNHAK